MAAVSLKKINKYALGEARTHKKFFIITNLVLGMGGALYTLMSSIVHSTSSVDGGDGQIIRENIDFEPSALGIVLLVVGAAMGLFAVVQIFRDMNSVQIGDVQLSLPMTANERYFSKLLALFYTHTLPLIVWLGVPSVINYLRCIAEMGVGEVTYMEFIPATFWLIMAMSLFIDAVTVICAVCCGAFAESIYFTLISIVCLSTAPLSLWFTLTDTCAGQSPDNSDIFSLWTLSFIANADRWERGMSYLYIIVINCLISLAVMAAGVFIYRRRDAKSLGDPICNRPFFEILMFGGLATVYSLFFFHAEAYIGVIIVAVIYFVICIITSRGKLGARKFGIWAVKFAASTLAVAAVAGVAYVTDGFGMINYISGEDLSGARISVRIQSRTEDGYYKDIRYDVSQKYLDYGNEQNNRNSFITELTDAQIRQTVKICQKYAKNHRKTFGEFMDFLMEGSSSYLYHYGYGGSDGVNVRVMKAADNKDPFGYTKEVHDQSLDLTVEEAKQMDEELSQLDFLTRSGDTIDYNDIDYYYPVQ